MNMRVSQNSPSLQPSVLNNDYSDNHEVASSGSAVLNQANLYRENSSAAALANSVQQSAQENPQGFRSALEQAFGGKADAAALDELAKKAENGNLPLPENVRFVDAGTLGANAMGAYDSAIGGTIYLDRRLLNDPAALRSVYTEELGHHLDAELGGADAAGDEGAIFSKSLLDGKINSTELQALKSEDDSGFITIDGKRVAVEFYQYSGPGSSAATGGTDSSSGSLSSSGGYSYSGPGSSAATGGTDSSSGSSSSSGGYSYSGPGSSAATGGTDDSSSPTSYSSGYPYSGPGSSVATGGTDSSYSSGYPYSGPGSSIATGGSVDPMDVDGGQTRNDRSVRDERSDRVDRRNVESDRRWRREEGGDGGNGHFNNDWAGRSILDRYLTGGGDWTIEDDPRWTDYMQNNPTLTGDLRTRAEDTAQDLFTGSDADVDIDETYSMQIENGEGIVGYQYLHGTNANVGDFERDGNASIVRHDDGSATVTMDMQYRWNDVIDPNPQYSTDRWKSTIAEIVTLGQADPYDIHIGWSETTVVELDSSGNVTSITNEE